MKCLKNIDLRVGFDKTISFSINSNESKRLEIVSNGAVLKTYFDLASDIFDNSFSDEFEKESSNLSNDIFDNSFSDEFEKARVEFFVPKSDVQELFNMGRFFKFRLIFGQNMVASGDAQVFDSVPDCAKKSTIWNTSEIVIKVDSKTVMPLQIVDKVLDTDLFLLAVLNEKGELIGFKGFNRNSAVVVDFVPLDNELAKLYKKAAAVKFNRTFTF